MSIKMQLLVNAEDRKKISKNPSPIGGEMTCILKENTSIVRPTMQVSTSALADGWAAANYAYIPDFNRYYFIDKPIAATGGMMEFEMTVDPLRTYKSGLLNTSFLVARSETNGSPYFIDAEKALQGDKIVDYEIIGHIPQDTTGNMYTLTVAGGL